MEPTVMRTAMAIPILAPLPFNVEEMGAFVDPSIGAGSEPVGRKLEINVVAGFVYVNAEAESDTASVVSTLFVLKVLVCSITAVLVSRIVVGAAEGASEFDTTEVTTTT
jgi:hypothetical protein